MPVLKGIFLRNSCLAILLNGLAVIELVSGGINMYRTIGIIVVVIIVVVLLMRVL